MPIPQIEPQIKEIRETLIGLSKKVNEHKELTRVHRVNSFNRRFSIVFSAFEDVAVLAERLKMNIGKSIELEIKIQKRNRNEDKEEITEEGQRLRRIANQFTRYNKTDFKALYVFSKIFLDKYTKLLAFITDWRDISNRSVTVFFHSLQKYDGQDPNILQFIDNCLKKLKAVDIFLTQYRDDFVVHHEINQTDGELFINSMDGEVRFLNPGKRPSITPRELIFVVRGYVVTSSRYIIDEWVCR